MHAWENFHWYPGKEVSFWEVVGYKKWSHRGSLSTWPINALTTTLTSWWPNKLTNEGRIPESITSWNMKNIQP